MATRLLIRGLLCLGLVSTVSALPTQAQSQAVLHDNVYHTLQVPSFDQAGVQRKQPPIFSLAC
jgi:hypothetical protein